MSLATARLARKVRVTGVSGSGPLTLRLMEMGLVEGAEVRVLRCAPLGDPLQISLGDFELSLRRSEAELIDVSAD